MAQHSIIPIVVGLNVERATDCARSLTLPIGQAGGNGDKIFCTAESIHKYLLSRCSAISPRINTIDVERLLCFVRGYLDDSIGLVGRSAARLGQATLMGECPRRTV